MTFPGPPVWDGSTLRVCSPALQLPCPGTYTLLLDDGLEAVQSPSVLGLLRVLYLQPHLQGQSQ